MAHELLTADGGAAGTREWWTHSREALITNPALNLASPDGVEKLNSREEGQRPLRGGCPRPFRFEPSDGWRGHIEMEPR